MTTTVALELAAYITANTGGANSPYAWSDAQTGNVKPPNNANAGLNTMSPNAYGCATADCAAGVRQTTSENRTQAQIDASLSQTTIGIATAPLWIPLVGGAAFYSPLGFALGAGGDAAGKAYQSYTATGEVVIRPAQSVFSAMTGAVALPLAAVLPAVGLSASGAAALAGNAVVGGATAVANTLFNNLYYDEATRLDAAGGLGAVFGAIGSGLGAYTGKLLKDVVPSSANIPVVGLVAPFSAQGAVNTLPTKIGNTISNTIGAVPAFIALDNGKNSAAINKSDEVKK